MLAFYLVTYQPLKYRDYVYPAWGQAIGWLITLSSLSLIPTVMIHKLINTTGSVQEVNICHYIHVRAASVLYWNFDVTKGQGTREKFVPCNRVCYIKVLFQIFCHFLGIENLFLYQRLRYLGVCFMASIRKSLP